MPASTPICVTGNAPDPGQRAAAAPPSDAPRFDARILVAEDNTVNQEVAVAMLEMLGCRVELAGDGRAAHEAVARTGYDLVLMDGQLRGLDGSQATAEIRRLEAQNASARRLPIVALTARVVEGDRERCIEAGMDDYLGKPFKRDALEVLLRRWLEAASDAPGAGSEGAGQPEETGAEDPLDRATLDALRDLQMPGRPSVLANVVHAYLESSADLLGELRDAAEARDVEALRRAAHALKSSSRNVGAHTLGGLCERLEVQGSEGDVSGAKDRVEEISAEHARAVAALRVELGA